MINHVLFYFVNFLGGHLIGNQELISRMRATTGFEFTPTCGKEAIRSPGLPLSNFKPFLALHIVWHVLIHLNFWIGRNQGLYCEAQRWVGDFGLAGQRCQCGYHARRWRLFQVFRLSQSAGTVHSQVPSEQHQSQGIRATGFYRLG